MSNVQKLETQDRLLGFGDFGFVDLGFTYLLGIKMDIAIKYSILYFCGLMNFNVHSQ